MLQLIWILSLLQSCGQSTLQYVWGTNPFVEEKPHTILQNSGQSAFEFEQTSEVETNLMNKPPTKLIEKLTKPEIPQRLINVMSQYVYVSDNIC